MAPKATSTSSTRLYFAFAEHQRYVHGRRRAHLGPPYRQRPRQRAGPGDDATDARNALYRRPQAHTALRSYREHAGLCSSGELWCRAQGDGSDDDAGKQLHVRARIPHLVPRRYVPTRTLAHASFPDTS